MPKFSPQERNRRNREDNPGPAVNPQDENLTLKDILAMAKAKQQGNQPRAVDHNDIELQMGVKPSAMNNSRLENSRMQQPVRELPNANHVMSDSMLSPSEGFMNSSAEDSEKKVEDFD